MKWRLLLLACAVFACRLGAQNGPAPFRITGAVVSREFPPGPADTQRVDPETEFLTTDPMAVVTFGYTGGSRGDKVRVEWRDPFGAVAQQWVIDQVGGSYGWYQSLPIAGADASKKPGNWELRIYWNDQGRATFPFRISLPPASTIHLISRTVLPRGTATAPYFFQFRAEGGTPPYHWALTGSAPPGLSLSSAGELSGVPSRRASYRLTVKVDDSAGNSLTRALGLGVAEISPGPHVTALALTNKPASPDACSSPAKIQNFSTQDLAAWFAFSIEGAAPDDNGRVEFLNPFGEVFGVFAFRRNAEARRCYEFNLTIAGLSPAILPGNWRVRLLWRDAEIETIPFQIVDAATAVLPGRRALVVGNGVYQKLPPIRSIAAEVAAVADALRHDGFDVTVLQNSTLEELQRGESGFISKLQEGDVALAYFAGYGFQRGGDNWLPAANFDPADTRPAANAYSVRRLRGELDDKRVRLAIIVLDAARELPALAGHAQSAGLAGMAADSRTVMVYAVPPGRTEKLPADSQPGPFAQAFVKAIGTPGTGVQQLLLADLPKAAAVPSSGRPAPFSLVQTSEEFVFRAAPAAGPIEFATPDAARQLVGFWEFGRAESTNPRLPAGPLCKFSLTPSRGVWGNKVAGVCEGRGVPELGAAFWRIEGERLHLIGGRGLVLDVLLKTSGDYWRGLYFEPNGVVYYLKRADVASTESLPALPCGQPLKSVSSNKAEKLFLRNDSNEERRLMWIDFQGQSRDYGTVGAGEQRALLSYQTHVWMVVDHNKACVALFRIGDRDALTVIAK